MRRLNGEPLARFSDLAPIGGLMLEIEQGTGRYEVRIALAGTLDAPALDGELKLTDARASVLPAG